MGTDDTGISVWDTEDAACVFGTHDIQVAQTRYTSYLRTEAGMNESDLLQFGTTIDEWATASQQWADPSVLEIDDERWPFDLYGSEQHDGWLPFLWLVR